MRHLSYKTIMTNPQTATNNWLVIDAENAILGRLSTRIASLLRGKHKVGFTPHTDCGDYVIVINASKVRMTGKKMANKDIVTYSGFPGGKKVVSPDEMLASKTPERLIEYAVRGMLPKNRIGEDMYRKLFVYAGNEHPHIAQKPTAVK